MNEPKTNTQNWLSVVSNMFQFILGFLLGVALIAGSAVGAAYFYFKKVSSHVPEKPVYSEETQTTTTEQASNQTTPNTEESSSNPQIISEPQVEPVTQEAEIPPNAYYANVTWPQGLSLRAEPSLDSERIGGIGYKARILILEESSDQQWQRVRIPESQQEGWVKAGNIEKADD